MLDDVHPVWCAGRCGWLCAGRCGVHVGGVQVVCRCRSGCPGVVQGVQGSNTHTQHTTTPQHKALLAFAWPEWHWPKLTLSRRTGLSSIGPEFDWAEVGLAKVGRSQSTSGVH